MSLIHMAELARVDPFDYLTQLQRHAKRLPADPGAWLPWNYRDTLAALATGTDPPDLNTANRRPRDSSQPTSPRAPSRPPRRLGRALCTLTEGTLPIQKRMVETHGLLSRST